jgi:hypothetical protein
MTGLTKVDCSFPCMNIEILMPSNNPECSLIARDNQNVPTDHQLSLFCYWRKHSKCSCRSSTLFWRFYTSHNPKWSLLSKPPIRLIIPGNYQLKRLQPFDLHHRPTHRHPPLPRDFKLVTLQYYPDLRQVLHLPNDIPYLAPEFELLGTKFRPRVISVEYAEDSFPVYEERLYYIQPLWEDSAGEMVEIAWVVEMEDIAGIQYRDSF